jgi:uncharacterized coiled-coil protein SlyX
MTDDTPRHAPTDRLTALEVSLAHMRERITELSSHNRVQDMAAERLADQMGKEIEKLRETAWSFLKWLGGTLFAVLLSVILKTLGLV